jgi:hypothetical protein
MLHNAGHSVLYLHRCRYGEISTTTIHHSDSFIQALAENKWPNRNDLDAAGINSNHDENSNSLSNPRLFTSLEMTTKLNELAKRLLIPLSKQSSFKEKEKIVKEQQT